MKTFFEGLLRFNGLTQPGSKPSQHSFVTLATLNR